MSTIRLNPSALLDMAINVDEMLEQKKNGLISRHNSVLFFQRMINGLKDENRK